MKELSHAFSYTRKARGEGRGVGEVSEDLDDAHTIQVREEDKNPLPGRNAEMVRGPSFEKRRREGEGAALSGGERNDTRASAARDQGVKLESGT